ncbi:hypothetical protein OAS39_04565 [Pirellulales bacterium]|nr:hypothetical protein [Pirellulales bacterium]
MGFRVLLIAASDKTPSAIHTEYGVIPTGAFEEIPESPVTGAELPGGAYLLYINDEVLPDDVMLGKLSKNASLLACYANETVMDSLASSWVNGAEVWRVHHSSQQGTLHLESDGELPEELAAIRERLLQEQEGEDDTDYVFDIPVELFSALGGIRYDEDIEGAGTNPWQVLNRTP